MLSTEEAKKEFDEFLQDECNEQAIVNALVVDRMLADPEPGFEETHAQAVTIWERSRERPPLVVFDEGCKKWEARFSLEDERVIPLRIEFYRDGVRVRSFHSTPQERRRMERAWSKHPLEPRALIALAARHRGRREHFATVT